MSEVTSSPRSVSGTVLRAAVIRIGADEAESPLGLTLGGVEVKPLVPIEINGKGQGWLYVGRARARLRIYRGHGSLEARAQTDAVRAIETIARLSSIETAQPFLIRSTLPYLGFIPTVSANAALLEGLKMRTRMFRAFPNDVGAQGMLDQVDVDKLRDRLDGVALFAEARNASGGLAAYVQLIRLFENAFRLGSQGFTDPLTQFLRRSPYRFRASEVRQWTAARALTFHADRRDEIFLDSDVRGFVPRMLQAGFDVLANKETWRHRSPARRDAWKPRTGTQGPDGTSFFATQGHPFSTRLTLLDGLGSFPIMLGPTMNETRSVLPAAFWITGDDVHGSQMAWSSPGGNDGASSD